MPVDRPSPEHPICQKCGLYKGCKSPFMEADGADHPEFMAIGEAPGESEDLRGVPFVGKTGRLLRDTMEELGIDSILYTNVVRCRPPDNKIEAKYIRYCAPFVIADIAEQDPATVMLFGNSPLSGVLGESGISSWHGVTIDKERKYVPLYHPAYIARNMSILDEWLDGIEKAIDGSKSSKPKYKRTIPRTLDEVKDMRSYLSKCEFISFDTETSTLDAFANHALILSVSFAGGDRSYSLPVDHPESWWDETKPGKEPWLSEMEFVKTEIREILNEHDGFVIGHNLKFDQIQAAQLLLGYFIAGGDSMLISQLLDSRLGIHDLKRLAGLHLGMYDYAEELNDYKRAHPEANPKRGGSYANIPLKILLPYGAMDAEATLSLHDKLYTQMTEKQKVLYDQLLLPASDALAQIEMNGMAVDHYIADRYAKAYRMLQREIYEQILQDKSVKAYEAKRNREWLEEHPKSKKTFHYNPGSSDQRAVIYFKYHKIPPQGQTKSMKNSTASELFKHMESDYPILRLHRYHNLLGKMLGTYLEPAAYGAWVSDDGLAHPKINLGGAITGRTSSSDPFNAQNIPTPEKEPGTLLEALPIKNIFTHRYVHEPPPFRGHGWKFYRIYGDGVVMSVDFSGMELRVMASVSNCTPMLKIFEIGKDVHSMVAIMSMDGVPIEEVTDGMIARLPKPIRYIYKWTSWTLLYMGDEYTLHHLYNIPLDEAKKTVYTYYDTFPQIPEYQKQIIEAVEENGYVESVFGRRERLPYINDNNPKLRARSQREAVNMTVQGPAGDTLLAAIVILEDKLRKAGYRAKIVDEVHDSIVLDMPSSEAVPVGALCKDVMENVKVHAREYMPDLDFSWLIAPLQADVDVGTHYGSLVDISKWRQLHV